MLFGLDAHSASSQDNYVASTRRSAAPEPDLAVLLPSWELHLRAERKSPQTVKTYGDGVRRYLGYCTDQGLSTLDRTSLASFIASLLGAGAEPATARSRHLAVRRFATWLLEEGEIDHDPSSGSALPSSTSGSWSPSATTSSEPCSRPVLGPSSGTAGTRLSSA